MGEVRCRQLKRHVIPVLDVHVWIYVGRGACEVCLSPDIRFSTDFLPRHVAATSARRATAPVVARRALDEAHRFGMRRMLGRCIGYLATLAAP